MTAMTYDQKVQLGAEIRRVRELKPRISRPAVVEASSSTLSVNTVLAVERGEAVDASIERVLQAMAALGRPVHIEFEEPPTPEEASTGTGSQAVGDLVTAILAAAPPAEREELKRNIWLLVRGRHAELISRLRG